MTPALIILSVIALMASVMAVLLLGELALPLSVAALGAVFIMESGRSRIFSILTPVLIIAVDVLCHGAASYLGLETVMLAIVVSLFLNRGSKAECAFWLTLTVTLFIVVAMALAAYAETKILTVDSFFDYYIGHYQSIEAQFVEIFPDISIVFGISGDKADSAVAAKVLRSMVSMIPSVVIVFAFFISGICLKVLTGIMKIICDADSDVRISAWRFSLPMSIYVAFWLALTANFIVGFVNSPGVAGIVIANVYNVLLYVFAYLGFGVVVSFLSRLFKSRPLAILATVGTILLFSSLAIELIAYFGAAFVFLNKHIPFNEN